MIVQFIDSSLFRRPERNDNQIQVQDLLQSLDIEKHMRRLFQNESIVMACVLFPKEVRRSSAWTVDTFSSQDLGSDSESANTLTLVPGCKKLEKDEACEMWSMMSGIFRGGSRSVEF